MAVVNVSAGQGAAEVATYNTFRQVQGTVSFRFTDISGYSFSSVRAQVRLRNQQGVIRADKWCYKTWGQLPAYTYMFNTNGIETVAFTVGVFDRYVEGNVGNVWISWAGQLYDQV
ncbi:hypothetical protein SEA_ENDOR_3 [Microbacterium phage Endor]|nr:hypothetical protein SEA_ENDOR_3 [Microbacterium phage Endor]